MFYASRGSVPHTRHTQHRAADGSLYAEELFGVEGFTGRSSLLYHLVAADADAPDRAGRDASRLEEADDGYHHHRLIDSAGVPAAGDAVTGRIPLFFNNDIVMGVVRPADAMPDGTSSTATARPTSCSSSTRATGLLDTNFGPLRYGPGDYLVLPIGTTWRLEPDAGSRPADAVPRVPVGDRGAQALSQRLRPAARARAVLAARHPAARRGRRRGPTRATSWSTSRCAAG